MIDVAPGKSCPAPDPFAARERPPVAPFSQSHRQHPYSAAQQQPQRHVPGSRPVAAGVS